MTRYLETVLASISLNPSRHDTPPLVHLALTGFLADAETVLDEARVRQAPAVAVHRLLAETLTATISAAASTDS